MSGGWMLYLLGSLVGGYAIGRLTRRKPPGRVVYVNTIALRSIRRERTEARRA